MDDRILGGLILVGSLVGVCLYFWLVFLSPWYLLIVQVSAFVAVAAVLAIMAWIGYTLATTPPPAPLEDLSRDLEETKIEEGEVEEKAEGEAEGKKEGAAEKKE